MVKHEVTLDTINTQHAKAVVFCVLLLIAAIPVSVAEIVLFGYNLGMLLATMGIVGWGWSCIEAGWRRANWLKGYYDDDKS